MKKFRRGVKNKEMKFVNEEHGIAYAIVIVFAALIIGGVLFMTLQEIIVEQVGLYNEQVVAGEITQNSRDQADTMLMLFKLAVPFFSVIAVVEYAIIKSIEAKGDRG